MSSVGKQSSYFPLAGFIIQLIELVDNQMQYSRHQSCFSTLAKASTKQVSLLIISASGAASLAVKLAQLTAKNCITQTAKCSLTPAGHNGSENNREINTANRGRNNCARAETQCHARCKVSPFDASVLPVEEQWDR